MMKESFVRSHAYAQLVQMARQAQDSEGGHQIMNDPTSDSDTMSTINETEQQTTNFPALIRGHLWNFCSHCGRRHDRSYNSSEDFCSEWCELMFNNDKNSKDGHHSKPFNSNIGSTSRSNSSGVGLNGERKINYREAFGKLNLFHIVSMSGINESHYNEDDPDFEEEVDQTWRLDIMAESCPNVECSPWSHL